MPLSSNMNIGIALGLTLLVGSGLYFFSLRQPLKSPEQHSTAVPSIDADEFETSDSLQFNEFNLNVPPASQLKNQEIKIIASLLAKELRTDDDSIQFENEIERHQSQSERLLVIESFFQRCIEQYDETYISSSHITDGLNSILEDFIKEQRKNNTSVSSGEMTIENRELLTKEALVRTLGDMVDLLGVVGLNDFKEAVHDYNRSLEKPLFNIE